MASFEKTEVLTRIFQAKYSSPDMAYAAMTGALLGTITDEQLETLIEIYSQKGIIMLDEMVECKKHGITDAAYDNVCMKCFLHDLSIWGTD